LGKRAGNSPTPSCWWGLICSRISRWKQSSTRI
jgi:hypothetical protein